MDEPYILINWWDMEQYSADVFFSIGIFLTYAKEVSMVNARIDPKGFVNAESRRNIIAEISKIPGHCDTVSLNLSKLACNRAIHEFDTNDKITHQECNQILVELRTRIKDEMSHTLFMYIPNDRAEWFNKERLFGESVGNSFPSASFDIKEAGSCFACARFTASVFHLMRALEPGLGGLGKVFGVSFERTNWQPVIEQIEAKIRSMGSDPSKAADWKEQHEYYSQAASSFMFFKDAWRNYTAHARGKYTQEEALTIMVNVKAFMQKLAARLSETTV